MCNDGQRVLPCPFCGGPAKVHKQFDGFRKIRGYYVCCNKKGCPVFASTRVKNSQGAVIADWNTRSLDVLDSMLLDAPEDKL